MTTSHQWQMLSLTMKKWIESRKTCRNNVCKACDSPLYTDMAGINEQWRIFSIHSSWGTPHCPIISIYRSLVPDWLKIVVLKGEGGKFVIGKKLDMQAAIHNWCMKECTLWCDKENYGSFVVHFVGYCTHRCDMQHMQPKYTKSDLGNVLCNVLCPLKCDNFIMYERICCKFNRVI